MPELSRGDLNLWEVARHRVGSLSQGLERAEQGDAAAAANALSTARPKDAVEAHAVDAHAVDASAGYAAMV